VIFDEGHVLKCRTRIQAKAACSLASDRRWVVTGTPTDTDVTDVYGLLLGLQVCQTIRL
jgi:SNF2 family DNA or RNA helicase